MKNKTKHDSRGVEFWVRMGFVASLILFFGYLIYAGDAVRFSTQSAEVEQIRAMNPFYVFTKKEQKSVDSVVPIRAPQNTVTVKPNTNDFSYEGDLADEKKAVNPWFLFNTVFRNTVKKEPVQEKPLDLQKQAAVDTRQALEEVRGGDNQHVDNVKDELVALGVQLGKNLVDGFNADMNLTTLAKELALDDMTHIDTKIFEEVYLQKIHVRKTQDISQATPIAYRKRTSAGSLYYSVLFETNTFTSSKVVQGFEITIADHQDPHGRKISSLELRTGGQIAKAKAGFDGYVSLESHDGMEEESDVSHNDQDTGSSVDDEMTDSSEESDEATAGSSQQEILDLIMNLGDISVQGVNDGADLANLATTLATKDMSDTEIETFTKNSLEFIKNKSVTNITDLESIAYRKKTTGSSTFYYVLFETNEFTELSVVSGLEFGAVHHASTNTTKLLGVSTKTKTGISKALAGEGGYVLLDK